MAKKDPAKEAIVRQINSLAGESVTDSELRNLSVAELQTIADAVRGMNPNTIPAPILAKIPKSDSIILNSANRVANQFEKQDRAELTKVQQAEISGLIAQDAPQSVVNAARAENKEESRTVSTAQKATGYQAVVPTVTVGGTVYTTSNRNAFLSDPAGQRVITALDAGYGLLDELNLTQQYMKGETTIGQNLYKLGIAADQRDENGNFVVTPELQAGFESPRSAPQMVRYLNAIADEQANPSLSNNAKIVFSGEKNGIRYEVLTDRIASGIKGSAEGVFVRYLDPANIAGQNVPAGTVQYMSGSTNITPTGDQGWLGKIISVVGSIVTPFNPLLGSAIVAAGTGINGGDFGDILKAVALNYAGYRAGGFLGEQFGLGSIGSVSDDIAAARNLLTNPIDELTAVANGIRDASRAVGSTIYDLVTDPRAVIDDFANRVANSPAAGIFRDPDALANPATLERAAQAALTPDGLVGGADVAPTVTVSAPAPTTPTGGIAGGVAGVNVAPPVEVTATQPPVDTNAPAITGGVAAQTPVDQAPPVEVVDRSQPVIPTPNPSLLDTARNVVDIAQEYVPPALVIASLLDQTPVPTGVGDNKLPAWVFDPAMSGVIPRIQAAQAAMPAPMPNLFNAQFQRGGLGAGQFIGYDLLNRTGDIPQQTLLGVSPLAMPPLNLLGVTGGQVPASQTSLVG